MKRISVIIILISSTFIFGNVRGPIVTRGSVSSNLNSNSGHIVLQKEDMIVRLPKVNQKKFNKAAAVSLTYYLYNKNDERNIKAAFLALNVKSAKILINGKNVLYKKNINQAVINEYLLLLFKNRFDKREKYRMFFYRIGYYSLYLRSTNFKNERKYIKPPYMGNKRDYKIFAQLLKLNGKKIYDNLLRFGKRPTFSTLEFVVPLKKGSNILSIKYRQRLNFNEHSAGSYFRDGINLNTAKWHFEYLLYPAFSWQGAQKAQFNLTVVMPHITKKGLLWDSRLMTAYQSNIVFQKKEYNKKKKQTVLKARFIGFPQKIFNFSFYKNQ